MMTNQSGSGLNRGLSSNFWWLRSVNHVKFTEECCDMDREACFSKKKMVFTNGRNIGLQLED